MEMPFPREEYLARLGRTKERMAKAGIDVLLVTAAANITWLSGYCSESAYVPQGLVVRADEEEPTIILRKMDAPAGIHTTFMHRDRVIGYPERYIADPRMNGYDFIAEHLKKGRIGIETDSLSWPACEHLKGRLGRSVDASGLVTWLRLRKSPREIAVMREAAEITDLAMAKAVEVVRPGVRECDAMAEVMAQLTRGTPRFCGDRGTVPLMSQGPLTGTCHLAATDATFKEGNHVNLEFGGFRHRYAAPLMRTISLGPPKDKLRRLHDAMLDGLEKALAAGKAGATCSDVAAAFNDRVAKDGFTKESRCGYAVGIDWTEVSASLREGDTTVLEPDMTFHLMLGMWVEEDFGAVLSETIRITDKGAEAFGRTARKLFVN
jgi:Xaa-Pro aminopeptidase